MCYIPSSSEMNILVSGCQKCCVFVIIATSILLCPEAKKQLKIRNFYCENLDDEFGKFTSCNIKAIRRDVSEVYVYFKLNKLINNGLLLNILLNRRGNAIMPILNNFTVDCCKFMENRKKHILPNLFFKVMGFEEFSNLNHTCPYKEDVIVQGYRIAEQYTSLLPIPYGEYSFILNWIYLNKPVLRNKISFEFFEKNEQPSRKVGAAIML